MNKKNTLQYPREMSRETMQCPSTGKSPLEKFTPKMQKYFIAPRALHNFLKYCFLFINAVKIAQSNKRTFNDKPALSNKMYRFLVFSAM